jgi:hypothetical protein
LVETAHEKRFVWYRRQPILLPLAARDDYYWIGGLQGPHRERQIWRALARSPLSERNEGMSRFETDVIPFFFIFLFIVILIYLGITGH